MRLKTTTAVLGAAALGSAFLVTGGATAAQVDAVTGGGQILFSDSGAGNTIAFTAKDTGAGDEPDSGQVQYVYREDGKGQAQTVQHGSVLCLKVQGNMAWIAGEWREGGTFRIYVTDNGQGSAADNDLVTVVPGADPTCDEDSEPDSTTALGRGNVQVHDNTE